MKKLLSSVTFLLICGVAYAGTYRETETYTVRENITIDTVRYNGVSKPSCNYRKCNECNKCNHVASSLDLSRPCKVSKCNQQPVKVKTHTEVIDHYQIYQPVTVYKPAGTCTTRRIIK